MLWHTDTISRGHQSWIRKVTATVAEQKVRVVIDRDSYDFQSRIYTEVWSASTLSWNRIETRQGNDHKELPWSGTVSETKIQLATNELVNDMLEYSELILL